MPRPKGARPDLRYKEKSIRPTSVTESVYLRFVSYAIGAGETIRDAMDAAMLAYMGRGSDDLKFLEEMKCRIAVYREKQDPVELDFIERMIVDWIDELSFSPDTLD